MTLDEALQLHRDGDLAAAESAYREHVLAQPDDADALHLLGVVRQQRGAALEARELISRAIALVADHAPLHLSLGGVLMALGDEDAARASFETALALDPNSVEAHSLIGHLQLREGDIDGAESRFKIGRRAQDEDPLILFGLGNVYLQRGDSANAMKFLARAAQYRPDDAAIQTSLGRALFDQGAFGVAEKAFENALRLRPELSMARLYLARSRLRQDRLEDARQGFAELLASKQQVFGAYAGLGDVARKKKQVVKALKFYKQALLLDPGHPGAINACAWCMESLGDLPAAARYLSEGLQHAPRADELRTPLSGILDKLGRADEAAQVRAQIGAQR